MQRCITEVPVIILFYCRNKKNFRLPGQERTIDGEKGLILTPAGLGKNRSKANIIVPPYLYKIFNRKNKMEFSNVAFKKMCDNNNKIFYRIDTSLDVSNKILLIAYDEWDTIKNPALPSISERGVIRELSIIDEMNNLGAGTITMLTDIESEVILQNGRILKINKEGVRIETITNI